MPSSPGYKRNYKREYAVESAQRRKQRAERNKARREFERMGKVHKHDGKEVDHKNPLSKGGSNRKSNLRVRSAHANHSYDRTHTGAMKYRDQRRTKR